MTPEAALSMLDCQLAKHGEDVILRRVTGTQKVPFEVTCRAFVRGYAADELIGTITERQTNVVIGVGEIDRAGWPGPNSSATPTTQDRRIPRSGDVVKIGGRSTSVYEAGGFYFGADMVRIEMRVIG